MEVTILCYHHFLTFTRIIYTIYFQGSFALDVPSAPNIVRVYLDLITRLQRSMKVKPFVIKADSQNRTSSTFRLTLYKTYNIDLFLLLALSRHRVDQWKLRYRLFYSHWVEEICRTSWKERVKFRTISLHMVGNAFLQSYFWIVNKTTISLMVSWLGGIYLYIRSVLYPHIF